MEDPAPSLSDLLALASLEATTHTKNYLAHISSLSLSDLTREPNTLASEASLLDTELNNLCQREYATFIDLHSTSRSLSASFDSLTSYLASLIQSVPDLEIQCRSFAVSTKEIQNERRKASLVLEHHDKLLDVLEIPQLIDTCVRNGYYQEAVDLSAHTASLAKQFPDVQVIRDVQAETEHAIRLMLSQLLGVLRQPAKLPVLAKAVTFLRRIGDFDENELALAFLTSRRVNLDSILASIEKERGDRAIYVRKYTDVIREGLYDVVNQFTVIFLDRPSTEATQADLRHLLISFTHHLLAGMMELLDSTLPPIDDPASLTSLLTKLTYCAASFSRIGLDFRSLLPLSFNAAVRTSTSRSLFAAATLLCSSILDAQKSNALPSAWLATSAAITSSSLTIAEQPIHIPPPLLSTYPPLAQYTNSLLTTLNSLRLLPPVDLLPQLIAVFNKSLYTTVSAYLAYCQAIIPVSSNDSNPPNRRRSLDIDEREKNIVTGAGVALVRLLVPFVKRGLVQGVFGIKLEELRGNADHDDELERVIRQWEEWHSGIGGQSLATSPKTHVFNGTANGLSGKH